MEDVKHDLKTGRVKKQFTVPFASSIRLEAMLEVGGKNRLISGTMEMLRGSLALSILLFGNPALGTDCVLERRTCQEP